jgi:hypothetical protein
MPDAGVRSPRVVILQSLALLLLEIVCEVAGRRVIAIADLPRDSIVSYLAIKGAEAGKGVIRWKLLTASYSVSRAVCAPGLKATRRHE